MAAGTGVMHSEFNPSSSEPVHLLQIWILPDRKGAKPNYAERSFKDAPLGRLNLVASKTGRDGSLTINQDTDLFVARYNGGDTLEHSLRPGRHAWLQVATGELSINGQKLSAGDGLAVSDESELKMTALTAGQLLLFDLN